MKHTSGKWRVFIDDSGDQYSGYPIAIWTESLDDSISIVRQGGFYPYSWDDKIPQREHVANAYLIAAAPDLLVALQGLLDDPQHAENRMIAINAIHKASGLVENVP
jgi:hypothetical protein